MILRDSTCSLVPNFRTVQSFILWDPFHEEAEQEQRRAREAAEVIKKKNAKANSFWFQFEIYKTGFPVSTTPVRSVPKPQKKTKKTRLLERFSNQPKPHCTL